MMRMVVPFRLGRSEAVAGKCAEGLEWMWWFGEINAAMMWG
jgi:hypothetical protein